MRNLSKSTVDIFLLVYGSLLKKVKPRQVVLCYHDLFDKHSTDFIPETAVSLELFEKQIKWISGFADFVTLDELVLARNKPLKKWRVAVTFDDGYRGVVNLALPILERFKVKVTWFITTDFVENPTCIPWWELVALAGRFCKGRIELTVGGHKRTFFLNGSPKNREFYRSLVSLFKHIKPDHLAELQYQLYQHLPDSIKPLENRMIRPEELARVVQTPWISVGCHTKSHPVLSLCSTDEIKKEISHSAEKLYAWTGQMTKWFSYPFGKSYAFDDRTISFLKTQGFIGAVTSEWGYVTPSTDLFRVPRYGINGTQDLPRFKATFLALGLRKTLRELAFLNKNRSIAG